MFRRIEMFAGSYPRKETIVLVLSSWKGEKTFILLVCGELLAVNRGSRRKKILAFLKL